MADVCIDFVYQSMFLINYPELKTEGLAKARVDAGA
jgi:hypothetical protein